MEQNLLNVIQYKQAVTYKDPCAFLQLDWQQISTQEQALKNILKKYPTELSGFSYASLFAWQGSHDYLAKFFNDRTNVNDTDAIGNTLLISCKLAPEIISTPLFPGRHLLQPVGEFPPSLQEELCTRIKEENRTVLIHGVTTKFLKKYDSFVSFFEIITDANFYNYIYSASELAELSGRKYQKKRNLLSQAQRLYTWTVKPLKKNIYKTKLLLDHLGFTEDNSTVWEKAAIIKSLDNFEKLELDGIVIEIDGEIQAFSIFEPQISNKKAVIHFERALKTYKGLYQVINNETAKYLYKQGYKEINREEDMGNEGLTQAKMSYSPIFLEPSYILKSVAP